MENERKKEDNIYAASFILISLVRHVLQSEFTRKTNINIESQRYLCVKYLDFTAPFSFYKYKKKYIVNITGALSDYRCSTIII